MQAQLAGQVFQLILEGVDLSACHQAVAKHEAHYSQRQWLPADQSDEQTSSSENQPGPVRIFHDAYYCSYSTRELITGSQNLS